MKVIALDYDGTFTSNPLLWSILAFEAKKFGEKVICVSARTDTIENRLLLQQSLPASVDIYLTSHNPKKEWMERRGIKVDIWIEDTPKAIFESDNPEKRIADKYGLETAHSV